SKERPITIRGGQYRSGVKTVPSEYLSGCQRRGRLQ
ncbi:MAG: hypothetical protein ACI9W6_000951, partial [Motiliproteus sp.]